MTLGENLRIGLDALLAQKVRSLLTMLGIIFGVGAVIAMTSISAGARDEMMEVIEGLGVNNVIVNLRIPDDPDEVRENKKRNPDQLSLEDAAALEQLLLEASLVVPLRREEAKVRLPESISAGLIGTWPSFADLLRTKVLAGRFLQPLDSGEKEMVAVLTSGAQRELFPLANPIGKRVKADGDWYTVVGVVDPPLGSFSTLGMDMPDMSRDIFVPLETLNARRPRGSSESPLAAILVQLEDAGDVRPAAAAIQRILQRRHRGATDFEIIVPVELLRQSQQAQRIFNVVMGAIASISLLVGGIGIMNIMLSNVLERTREIGVRRAMGARRRDVVLQFLLEAVLLSLIGGTVGVVLGVGMAASISAWAGWNTSVTPFSVLLAFTVSATVGIIFGWWPAKKASEMDVINALRYE